MSTVIVTQKGGPGCLAQVLWFLFIGWWAGLIWVNIAWLFMLTIVGIPLGVKMLNKVPKIFALRDPDPGLVITKTGDVTVVSVGGQVPQRNTVIRAIWFLLVGWWLSFLWINIAYLACLTIIGLPLGFWMFDKTPAVVSLRR